MAFQSKSLLAAVLLCVTQGARVAKKRAHSIAGVAVHNYRVDVEEWLVQFKPGTTDADIQSFCGETCRFQGHPSKGGVPFAAVHGGEAQVEEMVSKFADVISLLEPDSMDYMIPELDVQNVDRNLASWGLDAVGVAGRGATGSGVHIYIQDTGVRGSHSDFDGRVIPTIDLTSDTLVVCDDDSCAYDANGHGSHCAGSAAGRTYGVASDATIHAVKTLSDQGSGSRSWQMSAIDWVTANGDRPAVISMSLGGAGADPLYTTSIGAATDAGVTVVVAAGNSNSDSCYFSPAFAEQAITVGATDSSYARANYSNYGTCNNIMAPGSAIVSVGISSDSASTSLSGTSMACPHVSGGAALLLEADPNLTRDQILAKLTETAQRNIISGLMSGDPDTFLWVGAEAAPPAPTVGPTPAPAPTPGCPAATSTGPDSDGDCRCNSGLYCYENGSSGCTFSYTATWGYKSSIYFLPSCGGCVCE